VTKGAIKTMYGLQGKGGMKRITNTAEIDAGLFAIIKSPRKIEKCSENVVLEDIVLLKVL
jgi:hypothetical protein